MLSVAGIKTDVGGPVSVTPTAYNELFRAVTQHRFGQLSKLIIIVIWLLFLIIGLFSSGWYILWVIPIRQIPVVLALGIVLVLRRSRLRVDFDWAPNAFKGFIRCINDQSFWTMLMGYVASANLIFLTLKFSTWNIPLRLPRKESVDIPPNLNEQLVFLTAFVPNVLAVVYTCMIYALDYDRLTFPPFRVNVLKGRSTMTPYERIMSNQGNIAMVATVVSLFVTAMSPFIYFFFRSTLWEFSLLFVGFVFKINVLDHPKAYPTGLNVLWTSTYSCSIAIWLWEFVNNSFSVYLGIGPLHRHKLVSDRANSPEYSLLDGLHNKSYSLYTRLTAFQELLHIATNFPERRNVIYSKDVRKTPNLWTRYMDECLSVIDQTCASLGKPRKVKRPEPVLPTYGEMDEAMDYSDDFGFKGSSSSTAHTIRIKHKDDIFKTNNHGLRSKFHGRSTLSSSLSSSSSKAEARAPEPPLTPKNPLDDVLRRQNWFLSKINDIVKSFWKWVFEFRILAEMFLASPLGVPFRCTTDRIVVKMIPVPEMVVSAVMALTSLVCQSLEEDFCGMVQRDIAFIMDALDDLLDATESVLENPPVHWTDVYVKRGKARPDLSQVCNIQEATATGFEHVVTKFRDYLDNLHLSDKVQDRVKATLEDFLLRELEAESSLYIDEI